MKGKIFLVLGLLLVLVIAYIYTPLFLPSSEAQPGQQPAAQMDRPVVDEVEAEPLVVPTMAVKESALTEADKEPAFTEKQLEKFDWSKVDSSTLSDISYG